MKPREGAEAMTFRDYMEQVEKDAREAIDEGAGWHGTWKDMYDALFIDDAVAGNESGSYTFSAGKAAESARDLVFDDDFIAQAHKGRPSSARHPTVAGTGIEPVPAINPCQRESPRLRRAHSKGLHGMPRL